VRLKIRKDPLRLVVLQHLLIVTERDLSLRVPHAQLGVRVVADHRLLDRVDSSCEPLRIEHVDHTVILSNRLVDNGRSVRSQLKRNSRALAEGRMTSPGLERGLGVGGLLFLEALGKLLAQLLLRLYVSEALGYTSRHVRA
jgi:hypothetical protein